MINYNKPYRVQFNESDPYSYIDCATALEAKGWAYQAGTPNARITNTITGEIIQ